MINELIKLSMKNINIMQVIDLLKQNIKMLKGIYKKIQELEVGAEFFNWKGAGRIYKNVAFDLIKAVKEEYKNFDSAKIYRLQQVNTLINELDNIARSI